MALSNTAILNAKPKEKAYSLTDERGLSIQIQPSGGKWWRFRYRFESKAKMLSLGVYPDVSLKEAREKRDEVRKYYKPMDAVGRMATIAAASENLGEDALLSALVQEVRELKGSLHSVVNNPRREISWDSTLSVRALLRDKNLRKELFALFEGLGGTSKTWAEVLRKRVSVEFAQATKSWPDSEWKRYIEDEFASLPPPVKKAPPEETVSPPVPIAPPSPQPIDDGLVERVRLALPVQPWPKGIHKEIIADLKITAHQYKKAVATLTNRGVFKQQVDGVLLDMDV